MSASYYYYHPDRERERERVPQFINLHAMIVPHPRPRPMTTSIYSMQSVYQRGPIPHGNHHITALSARSSSAGSLGLGDPKLQEPCRSVRWWSLVTAKGVGVIRLLSTRQHRRRRRELVHIIHGNRAWRKKGGSGPAVKFNAAHSEGWMLDARFSILD